VRGFADNAGHNNLPLLAKQGYIRLVENGEGNVWVTDYGNDRVQEFNEKGEYLAQFGSEGTGNGPTPTQTKTPRPTNTMKTAA
jgi:hypothetical protein